MKHPSRGKVIEKKKNTRHNQTKRALEFRAAVHHNSQQFPTSNASVLVCNTTVNNNQIKQSILSDGSEIKQSI
jgi:hypothetical protein